MLCDPVLNKNLLKSILKNAVHKIHTKNAATLRNMHNALTKFTLNNHSLDIGPLKHMDEREGMTIFFEIFW